MSLAANPSICYCFNLNFQVSTAVYHTEFTWNTFPFHSAGHAREPSLCHYLVFTDAEQQCKSAEGSGELVWDLRGTAKEQYVSGQ